MPPRRTRRARASVHRFARRPADGDDVVLLLRNTTEAINHLAYRLRLEPDDVVVTTVVEHHANLLPWARVARRRWVECGPDGTFGVDDVVAVLDEGPPAALLAVTGASNVTGWLPPVEEICAAAHERDVPVVLDAAQLAPHRPLPDGPDFVAFSGHKLYAPYGAGALVGPRRVFETGDPFLAGGGAVDLVDLDEVIWTEPPEREEAGSPNVIGAVAFGAAMDELRTDRVGRRSAPTRRPSRARLHDGLRAIDGVTSSGRATADGRRVTSTLAVATFTVVGLHHALVAARLSAECGIGVRHGCFCAHPYLIRLLGVGRSGVDRARDAVRRGDRSGIPGAVRASCGLGTTAEDVDALLDARARRWPAGRPPPVPYVQDPVTGDFWPESDAAGGAKRTARPGRRAPGGDRLARRRRLAPVCLAGHRAIVGRLLLGGAAAAPGARRRGWVATGASVTLPGHGGHTGRPRPRAASTARVVRRQPALRARLHARRPRPARGEPGQRHAERDRHRPTDGVVRNVGVGVEPDAVAVAPGGTDGKGVALVANFGSDTVTPVDLGTWRAGTPVPVGTGPVADRRARRPGTGAATAFVADFGSDDGHTDRLSARCKPAPADPGRRPSPGRCAVALGGDGVVGELRRPARCTPIDAPDAAHRRGHRASRSAPPASPSPPAGNRLGRGRGRPGRRALRRRWCPGRPMALPGAARR